MIRCLNCLKYLFCVYLVIAVSIFCYETLFSVGSSLPTEEFIFHHQTQQIENISDNTALPFCQRADQFLKFKDKLCAGVLHKMDDFLDAAYLAVKSDRTLVSYVPGVEYRHMRDNNNNRVRNKTKKRGRVFFHGWTWGDMLDTKQFVYEKFDQSGNKHLCRLRVVSASYVTNNFGSISLASDMPIFQNEVFARDAPFLIYVTEQQLQDIADAIVLTYPGHRMRDQKKVLGSLVPDKCTK
ncbi:uncharacterized protein LOC142351872 [Convolutriloba macropyga]|uniref:uncharacterized protein LOC142351872 n=1 Tax=Convolutriloba macropyga TaxID=536237 RepID=UPI003F525BDF